jgi:hypothetical protein
MQHAAGRGDEAKQGIGLFHRFLPERLRCVQSTSPARSWVPDERGGGGDESLRLCRVLSTGSDWLQSYRVGGVGRFTVAGWTGQP